MNNLKYEDLSIHKFITPYYVQKGEHKGLRFVSPAEDSLVNPLSGYDFNNERAHGYGTCLMHIKLLISVIDDSPLSIAIREYIEYLNIQMNNKIGGENV